MRSRFHHSSICKTTKTSVFVSVDYFLKDVAITPITCTYGMFFFCNLTVRRWSHQMYNFEKIFLQTKCLYEALLANCKTKNFFFLQCVQLVVKTIVIVFIYYVTTIHRHQHALRDFLYTIFLSCC